MSHLLKATLSAALMTTFLPLSHIKAKNNHSSKPADLSVSISENDKTNEARINIDISKSYSLGLKRDIKIIADLELDEDDKDDFEDKARATVAGEYGYSLFSGNSSPLKNIKIVVGGQVQTDLENAFEDDNSVEVTNKLGLIASLAISKKLSAEVMAQIADTLGKDIVGDNRDNGLGYGATVSYQINQKNSLSASHSQQEKVDMYQNEFDAESTSLAWNREGRISGVSIKQSDVLSDQKQTTVSFKIGLGKKLQ